MSNRLLIRPELQKTTSKKTASFVPVDLAAAYACYHHNLKEQKHLGQKLHIIDLETNQMKRDFRQQREALERELKQNEKYYWNCHRVFSAATLITESDSYKKKLYAGPQPTKAKLPRRTLERLSQLVRKLQAEDDLGNLWRFQRCARFAHRREARPNTASSSTLSWEGKLNPSDQENLTALMNERTTDSVVSVKSNASGRIKRIRSAPSRVASGKTALSVAGYSKEGHIHPLPRQHSPKKPKESFGYSPAKGTEDSDRIDFYTGDRERVPMRLAWAEDKAVAVDDGFKGTDESVPDVNCTGTSCDGKQTSKSIIEQSRDDEKLFVTSTLYQTLQSRDTELFDLTRPKTDWPAKPHIHEYLQSDETLRTKDEGAVSSELSASNVMFSSPLEEKARGDENADWLNDGLKKVNDVRRKRRQSPDTGTTSLPHKGLSDDQRNEKHPNASRKRKVSIFKRKLLSDVLLSGQEQVESQLRNRVQGFLGTVEDVGESEEEEME